MRRMKPEIYKGEAHRRVRLMENGLIISFGEWNAFKVEREIERELRDRRMVRQKEKKDA